MKVALRGLAAVVIFWFVTSFAAERISLEPPRSTFTATPGHWGMPYSAVTFRSADGIALSGWWIPSTAHRTVVMVHGLGSNRDEPLSRSAYLHAAGYNILVFDLRGQGLSGGNRSTMGYREPADVRAAVAEARRHDPGPIVLFGYSLGAAAAIEEAATDPNVQAVIEDSAFSSAADVILARFSAITRLPSVPFAAGVMAFGTLDFGTSPWNVRPVAMAAELHKPLLAIVGTADTVVPPAEGEAIFKAAAGPKELLEIAGAGHVDGYYAAPALYESTVLRFLDASLGG